MNETVWGPLGPVQGHPDAGSVAKFENQTRPL